MDFSCFKLDYERSTYKEESRFQFELIIKFLMNSFCLFWLLDLSLADEELENSQIVLADDLGVIEAVIQALKRHRKVADVCRYGTKALENLASQSGIRFWLE